MANLRMRTRIVVEQGNVTVERKHMGFICYTFSTGRVKERFEAICRKHLVEFGHYNNSGKKGIPFSFDVTLPAHVQRGKYTLGMGIPFPENADDRIVGGLLAWEVYVPIVMLRSFGEQLDDMTICPYWHVIDNVSIPRGQGISPLPNATLKYRRHCGQSDYRHVRLSHGRIFRKRQAMPRPHRKENAEYSSKKTIPVYSLESKGVEIMPMTKKRRLIVRIRSDAGGTIVFRRK